MAAVAAKVSVGFVSAVADAGAARVAAAATATTADRYFFFIRLLLLRSPLLSTPFGPQPDDTASEFGSRISRDIP
ncbi:hypothetical protein GCM10017674_49790 [Streptomyces gardneri]|uniref:Uncharacterized protein n=1 Tax=Streptomyces gardneri TaxID=66892 RepID=A0A4Y3RTE2_9ACTN|nr:hypothetical protein SGA01_62040 [Streptomyces gardneri]GHH07878.1 hypothetical protein GCM10017674_49790 [Streptomyces gardneri]